MTRSELRFVPTVVSTPAMSVATECRNAALRFINEGEYWNKKHLGAWLATSYAACFQAIPSRSVQDAEFLVAMVDERFVERMIRAARSQVLGTLAGIERGFGSAIFAEDLLCSSGVARTTDTFGEPTFIPVPGPTSLGERVLALFAADALARPKAYLREIAICNECELVSFDHTSRLRGVCDFHHELRMLSVA